MPPSTLLNYDPKVCVSVSDLDDVDQLVRTYRPRVLAYAFSSLRDMDLAETVTQECFMRAFNNRHIFRGQCRVSTWLIAIVTNLIRDHTRTLRFQFWKTANASAVDPRKIENHMAGPQQSAESTLIARQELRVVWDVVDGFSRKQRAVFLLRFVEEMEVAEIAVRIGISRSTVKSHLHRAVGAIRRKLGRAR